MLPLEHFSATSSSHPHFVLHRRRPSVEVFLDLLQSASLSMALSMVLRAER
jgi:hypothetical protein